MKIEWKNPEAGKRFAEMVRRGDVMTADEMGELLELEGHNVTVEGPVVTVYPARSPEATVTLVATHKGARGDVLP